MRIVLAVATVALTGACLPRPVLAGDGPPWSGNVALSSDDVFRGISQSAAIADDRVLTIQRAL